MSSGIRRGAPAVSPWWLGRCCFYAGRSTRTRSLIRARCLRDCHGGNRGAGVLIAMVDIDKLQHAGEASSRLEKLELGEPARHRGSGLQQNSDRVLESKATLRQP